MEFVPRKILHFPKLALLLSSDDWNLKGKPPKVVSAEKARWLFHPWTVYVILWPELSINTWYQPSSRTFLSRRYECLITSPKTTWFTVRGATPGPSEFSFKTDSFPVCKMYWRNFQHRSFCKGKTRTEQWWATSRSYWVSCNFIHRSAILNLFAGWGVPEPQCSI